MLAEKAGVLVLSVDYRLAPEHPFPAAHDDAVASYSWAVAHATELGADLDQLAVGGDSAGASLAASVAIDAAQRGLPLALQLLIYPGTDISRRFPSYDHFGKGFLLDEETVDLMRLVYAEGNVTEPRISVRLQDPLPSGLAAAIVVVAGFDILRDDGLGYAAHLRASGVSTDLLFHAGLVHGFANVLGIGRSQRRASVGIAHALGARLATGAIEEVTA